MCSIYIINRQTLKLSSSRFIKISNDLRNVMFTCLKNVLKTENCTSIVIVLIICIFNSIIIHHYHCQLFIIIIIKSMLENTLTKPYFLISKNLIHFILL